ncbi:MAG TPA: GMC family oxidoreductase, partial [Gammaproteobacteria bacterium]|nr:GMC family oxidoreductase [Gammaproteobacteria bacterium]
GGAVMAHELQKAGEPVLVVEEGTAYKQGMFRPYSLSEMTTLYRHGGITTTLGKPPVKYVEGCCLGGGSEINSGLYYRTPPEVIRQWSENYRVSEFTEESLSPHFTACEKRVNVCYMPGEFPASSLKLLEGASKLGWDCREIPRWYKYDDKQNPSPVEGIRQSMSETYLASFLQNGGEIRTGIRVDAVKQNSGTWKATGRMVRDGTPVEISASRIILSAGAIQSPVILRRSGYTRNIGNSLKLHSTAKVIARFNEEINNELTGVPVHQIREFAPYQSFGCSVSSPAYLRLSLLDNPDFDEDIDSVWRHMASYYVMISGGVGTIRSYPFLRDPVVRYKLDKANLVNLALGVKRLTQVMFAAGARKVYPSIKGARGMTTESDIHQLPNSLDPNTANLMTIHLMGSCPMGEDLRKAAVNSYGQVHGTSGLYVSDASLIGNELGVNPQGTVMALSRRNAHHILGNK